MQPARSETLDRYAAAFRAARDRARILVDGLSDDQFNWKPSPERWSVAECLAHLNVVHAGYEPVLDRLIAAAPRTSAPGPMTYGWVGRRFVQSLRPGAPPMRSPRAMRPTASQSRARSRFDREQTLAEFEASTERLLGAVDAACAVDAGRIRVPLPILPLLRLRLPSILDGLGQHALRHVGQAERVVAHAGFPR